MKKKILLSPLIIMILIIVMGAGVAGAAILIGGGGGTEEVNLQKGLVGNWKFNGDAKDATPYGNNGTVTGAVFTTDRKGTANRAYTFNGTSDNISIADPGTGSILDADYITVSAWIKPSVVAGATRAVVNKRHSGGGTRTWEISVDTNGKAYWQMSRDNTESLDTSSVNGAIVAGNWYHVVGTYNGTSGILYVNGSAVGTPISVSGTMGKGNDAILIGKNYNTPDYFAGVIDDVRVYNRALSAAEITALYQEYDPGIQVSDLQKGLVGNWKFNGDAKDATPYGNNGTPAGNAAVNATDRKGQVNKALSLDGTGDYVNAGNNSSINITGNLTLGFWVNFNSLTNYQEFVGKFGGTDGADTAYEFRKTSAAAGNNLQFCHGNGTSEPCATVSTGALSSTGTWYHVVVTRSGTTISFYINGALDSSPTLAGTVPGTTGNAWIGERNDGNYPLDGKLDDVRIYNRALTATEVTDLYQEYDPGMQVSDLQKGLVGQWKMDGNAKDNTPYGNNGTATGATLTTDRKSQALKAYDFDGNDYVNVPDSPTLDNFTQATFSFWAYANGTQDASSAVLDKGPGSDRVYSIGYHAGTSFLAYVTATIDNWDANRAAVYTPNVWQHWAIVFKASTNLDIYINGVLSNGALGGAIPASIRTNGYALGIGSGSGGEAGTFFNGKIDDVRIYNRALSAVEVLALYESY